MSFRPLSDSELAALLEQGCFCPDWAKITVSENFSPAPIHHIRFLGEVRIGSVAGLYNCKIENCEIGNGVFMDHVHLAQNYRFNENVRIENVDEISVAGPTSFGNGVELNVLNEGGGRELLMYEQLTAQIAYILVCYRHDPKVIEAINGMIQNYVNTKISEKGSVGEGTTIRNSGTIHNLKVGSYATISGASLLMNGTIVSNHQAPVFVGESVIAKNFIVLSGSRMDGGALIDRSFIGQGVEIGKQFSAENSIFFANCEAFHGEAVSIFAGPYTVTHHKSTLLIAGQYSFYNAGSGTNQSNHMYKLGPIHQGIMERGSKTGSFAYLLWPSRIGAFSVVMGKNPGSFDSGDFPFSYINVDHERSILTPGMNLFTVGTRRDSEKWPRRDKRKDPEKYDLINFDLLSPYVVQKVIRSIDILTGLYENASQKQETVFYKGIRIKRLMLKSTRKYYQMALSVFIGDQIIKRLDKIKDFNSFGSVRKALVTDPSKGTFQSDDIGADHWVDLAGMVAPQTEIQNLLNDIKKDGISHLEEITTRLEKIHESYDQYAWEWTSRLLAQRFGIEVNGIHKDQLIDIISNWESDHIKLDKMILNDASKEFDNSSKIGFGIDGDPEVTEKDFQAVRGLPGENSFIAGIHDEIALIEEKAAFLRRKLEKVV